MNQEGIPFTPLQYYDNKETLDQILGKPEGVITLVDDASRMGHGGQYIIGKLDGLFCKLLLALFLQITFKMTRRIT